LREQGYTVKGNGARFYDSTGKNYTQTDLFAIRPNGEPLVIELKTGAASSTQRQTQIYPEIMNGAAIPSRPVATMLGIKPGIPLNQQGYSNGIPVFQLRAPGL
jgi:filamentous hemagglutinin